VHGSAPVAGEPTAGSHQFVVVANRLPVDRVVAKDGEGGWQASPGGLVTALEPVMRREGGAWVGWAGLVGEAPDPFDAEGMHLVAVPLSAEEVEGYYEGFCNTTLWPLYHDVIAAPVFHRRWWDCYVSTNRRFAMATAAQAAPEATVWVQDYQLQLVPAMLREVRPDLRIGFFDHIPFPGYEIFAQLPWRRQVVEGLLGADLIGFQRQSDATNFLRAARRAAGRLTRGPVVSLPGREVRTGHFPISIDTSALTDLVRTPALRTRAEQIRESLGNPTTMLLGVDRLDYTKGIRHRLKAYEELLEDGLIGPPDVTLVQIASPSRERVAQYQELRREVEASVGRINGDHGRLGHPAVHYLHQSFPRDEMAAFFLAADVCLVTALRDGMNLVAKEYVACHPDDRGVLVLSEFAGASYELTSALLINPHDIPGLKEAILRAVRMPRPEAARRMRSMRRRVESWDVHRWATSFLGALDDASRRTGEPAGVAPR
jgi:alpha,alpha-trehalose-phosphate synthase [UDP-forming]